MFPCIWMTGWICQTSQWNLTFGIWFVLRYHCLLVIDHQSENWKPSMHTRLTPGYWTWCERSPPRVGFVLNSEGWSVSVSLIKAGVELLHRRTRTREGQQSAARTCASSWVIIWSNILWGTFFFFCSLHAFQHNNTNDPPAECRKFKPSLIYLTSPCVLSPSPFIYVDELRFFHVALLNKPLLPKSLAVHLQRRSSGSGNSVGGAPQAAGGVGVVGLMSFTP